MFEKTCNFGFMNQDNFSEPLLFIEDMGIELRKKEQYHYQNRKRTDISGFLFQYTLSGVGEFEMQGVPYQLKEGDAFFVCLPHESSYRLPEGKDSEWHYFYIHFTGSTASSFYKEITKKHGNLLHIFPESAPIQSYIKECNEIRLGKKYKRLQNSEWLYHFLCELFCELETPTRSKTPFIESACSWMHKNYDKGINLSDLCQELHVTASHLSREFKSKLGTTPVNYLTQIRMEHALKLLLNTSFTIQEIAQMSGFSCSNYFAKVFRAKLNMSPQEYRSSHTAR